MFKEMAIMKKLAENPQLIEKLKTTNSVDEIVALAKREGVDITAQEVEKAIAQKDKYKGMFGAFMK